LKPLSCATWLHHLISSRGSHHFQFSIPICNFLLPIGQPLVKIDTKSPRSFEPFSRTGIHKYIRKFHAPQKITKGKTKTYFSTKMKASNQIIIRLLFVMNTGARAGCPCFRCFILPMAHFDKTLWKTELIIFLENRFFLWQSRRSHVVRDK